jgi:Rrf2 family transcriptional regulator, cysteine metabolism repressor
MMFSTKAEYGVRVMAHLARRDGDAPIPLASIAEAEALPLAYLEHLVQRLRRAQLVESRRGVHGGYTLARPAESITMAEIVAALEGEIAPIECISEGADGALICIREGEPGHDPCPTKLLWTRVRGSIIRTLEDITLADLLRPHMRKAPGKEATSKVTTTTAKAPSATGEKATA